ncbi:hypothetical protein [uncultured Methanobrevibacter sp.]|uniref:hypothetical protein n=1 Tax=uncultured Methanobrevibacter sp. TaxID=253161 RepID=UPI0025F09620|nr:hypothetical protein [uncultured Methanobrevibacter sp.]
MLSSRSATVLVIAIVAIVAFCLASVFGAMTGPISILPNGSEEGGVLDNLSSFVEHGDTGESYGNTNYDNHYSEDSHNGGSNVETTTDSGHSEDTSGSQEQSSSGDNSHVETTTQQSSETHTSESSSSSNVETTTA